jgi:hypothetical protein
VNEYIPGEEKGRLLGDYYEVGFSEYFGDSVNRIFQCTEVECVCEREGICRMPRFLFKAILNGQIV